MGRYFQLQGWLHKPISTLGPEKGLHGFAGTPLQLQEMQLTFSLAMRLGQVLFCPGSLISPDSVS